jgi:sulfur-oxidizing protein SoxY
MSDHKRRGFLRSAAGASALGLAWATGMLASARAWAAWPKAAFEAKEVKEMMAALFAGGAPEPSAAVSITMPQIAENGGQVPVVVQADLPKVDSITVIAEGNPRPLVVTATYGPRAMPTLSTRMKLAKTMKITAVVRSDGKLYSAQRSVEVSVGGCGG